MLLFKAFRQSKKEKNSFNTLKDYYSKYYNIMHTSHLPTCCTISYITVVYPTGNCLLKSTMEAQ